MSVTRVVPDFQAAEPTAGGPFYAAVLGLELVMDLGWIATFAAPGDPSVQLSVISRDATAPVQPDASIEVDDVDAAHAAAVRLGCEILHPLTDEPWGVRRFFVRDPSGKVLNVLAHRASPSPPSWPETGSVIGLDHVQVAAPRGCEAQARRFFGELLGLAEVEKPEILRGRGGVWFALGQQQLHVGVEEPFSPAVKAHPALRVAAGELESLADDLSCAGMPVEWDDTLAGARRFSTEDPWGNRIELLTST